MPSAESAVCARYAVAISAGWTSMFIQAKWKKRFSCSLISNSYRCELCRAFDWTIIQTKVDVVNSFMAEVLLLLFWMIYVEAVMLWSCSHIPVILVAAGAYSTSPQQQAFSFTFSNIEAPSKLMPDVISLRTLVYSQCHHLCLLIIATLRTIITCRHYRQSNPELNLVASAHY